MTVVVKLPSAQPVENHVFCTECNDVHEADLDNRTLSFNHSEDCLSYLGEYVDRLPKDWDKQHFAEFDGDGFRLFPANPSLLPCHRPMYFLEEE